MRKIIVISLFAFFLLFGAGAVFASSGFGLENTAQKAGYETTGASVTVASRVQSIVSVVLGFVAILFFGLTLYGGIMWMTARGKEDRVAHAKEILEAAIIGLAVVGSSYAIANFILGRIGGANSNKSKICTTMDLQCWPINSAADEQACVAQGYTVDTGTCD